MSEPDLSVAAQTIVTKLGESTTFDSLDAKVTTLSGAVGALNTAINDFNGKEAALNLSEENLSNARENVLNILASLGSGVEEIAEGETTIVVASGFELHAEKTPVGPLAPPQNLRLYMADIEGQIKARWDRLRGAKAYIIEYSLEGSGVWKYGGVSTKVSHTVSGLESGKKYRIRVRGVGAAGDGPWSDEAVKMAA